MSKPELIVSRNDPRFRVRITSEWSENAQLYHVVARVNGSLFNADMTDDPKRLAQKYLDIAAMYHAERMVPAIS